MDSDGNVASGISRRDAIKRGAIVGGTIAWAVPTVQSVGMSAAFGQGGSAGCSCKVDLFNAGGCLARDCDLSPSACDCLRNQCSCDPAGSGCACDFVTVVPGSCSPC